MLASLHGSASVALPAPLAVASTGGALRSRRAAKDR
jgi:hypothetical protein